MGKGRQRDIFPLPLSLFDNSDDPSGSVCRSVRRRALRRNHALEVARKSALALNQLYGGEGGSLPASGHSDAQCAVAHNLRRAALDLGAPPDDLTPQGALSALLGARGYEGGPSNVAAMDVDLIALPPAGFTLVCFEQLVGADAAQSLLSSLHSTVLPKCEAEEKLLTSGLKKPYFDPSVRCRRRKYLQFIRLLQSRNSITYKLSKKCSVGAFCVWKKDGQQRLVLDARLANCYFGQALPVELATGQSFARVEVDGHGPVEVGGVDIAVAFYAIQLPETFQE